MSVGLVIDALHTESCGPTKKSIKSPYGALGVRVGLSAQEQILIEQQVAEEARSHGVAYLLWFFFGGFGAHRFYIGRTGSGLIMLALLVSGLATVAVGVGTALLVIEAVWVVVDAFLIPSLIHQHKVAVRQRLSVNALFASSRLTDVKRIEDLTPLAN